MPNVSNMSEANGSNFMSEANKVGTHGRASVVQNRTASTIMFRRCIQSLRSSRHFCFSSLKMRCPLRFLTHFLNARHTQKCIPAQSRCLFIASPQQITASPHHHLFGHFNISFGTRHNQCWALEYLWLRLGKVQTSLTLRSPRTKIPNSSFLIPNYIASTTKRLNA